MKKRAKVLLIDDDYEYINGFGDFLSRMGYDVYKTGTGTDGIRLAKEEQPDIVMCDLLMLDINGDEVLKEIRKDSPDSIFIMVSAYVDDKTKDRLRKLGAHSFIEKIVVFKPTELYIRNLIAEKSKK